VELTVDTFQALARSSPWRWRRLHFRTTGGRYDTEAWIVRPGWQLVREGSQEYVTDEHRGQPETPPPTYRPDGLVASRPLAIPHDVFDDPLWPQAGYDWVAMLDPQELSHDVTVTDLRPDEVSGRTAWRATLRADAGYEARCPDCCDLLLGGFSQRLAYDVALDLETGIVVDLRALEGERDTWLHNEIVAVDDDVSVPA
jgi:hypothetical protein